MENHPVPQNISSYEFRLVGDMTLKQFLQLAGGILVGFVIIKLQILDIIKYPLAGLSVIIGILMAFVPINGRPFTSWLVAFFKAIYSPTEFVWVPEEMVAQTIAVTAPQTPNETPSVIPQTQPTASAVNPKPQVPAIPKAASATPSPIIPSFSEFLSSKIHKNASEPAYKETTLSKIEAVPKAADVTQPTSVPNQTLTPGQSVPINAPIAPTSQISPNFPVQPINQNNNNPAYTQVNDLPKTASVTTAPSAATSSMISSPTNPNILSGLITDPQNQPIPQITVEIVDVKTGIPARALRTNKLGQFQIAIPLPAGTYNVVAEKEGLTFDPVSVQIKGSIVPPVIIQGKSK